MKALFTTVLDARKLDQIKQFTTPFPGIYQTLIDKAREWRVTVYGEKVFSAAIYTQNEAKDDWRKHQLTSSVQFKNEQLADSVQDKCILYLARLGLRFGAFDFVETSDGELFFLECNPNGQYGWLEDELGFPISESIATELQKIVISRED